MTENELHIAQLQEPCKRTLDILEESKFFEKTDKDGFWNSSLYYDLERIRRKRIQTLFKYIKNFNK